MSCIFRFNNGWIIKIGRGLDYFKRPKVRLDTSLINPLFNTHRVESTCGVLIVRNVRSASQGRFSIGYCDYDLRQCHETTVDIFHTKHTKTL